MFPLLPSHRPCLRAWLCGGCAAGVRKRHREVCTVKSCDHTSLSRCPCCSAAGDCTSRGPSPWPCRVVWRTLTPSSRALNGWTDGRRSGSRAFLLPVARGRASSLPVSAGLSGKLFLNPAADHAELQPRASAFEGFFSFSGTFLCERGDAPETLRLQSNKGQS